jgi:hypothetical protein
MEAHAILLARDLARIGRRPGDRGDAHRVARAAGLRADDDQIAGLQPRVTGEPRVDRDGARLVALSRRRDSLRGERRRGTERE